MPGTGFYSGRYGRARRRRMRRYFEEQIILRNKRRKQRKNALTSGDAFGTALQLLSPVSAGLPPVPGPSQVFVTDAWSDVNPNFALSIYNTQVGWNVIKSFNEMFPLWWDRMR